MLLTKDDKEKYRDMLLEAAETVLGYFGFDRTVYGDTSKKGMPPALKPINQSVWLTFIILS